MGFSFVAAIISSAILLHMIGFQLLLALGFPLGRAAWGGRHLVLPTHLRVASLLSCFVLLYAALVVLEKAGTIELINITSLVDISVWLFAGFFLLNAIANIFSKSMIERVVMSPLALLTSLLFFAVAAK